jgi:hypothetical protein
MPDQVQEAQDAIRRMEDALRRVRQEALDVYGSDDYANERGEARERYRRLRQKFNNLRAVIQRLSECTIEWGPTRESSAGHTDRSTDPPTITLADTWQGIREAVVAQILAHEAIHALTTSPNSVDQEVRCRRKELEVWDLLKGNERHVLDIPCEHEQRLAAQGEDAVRAFIRGAYPGAPEHDEPPPPPAPAPQPPERPRRRLRIERADYVVPRLRRLLVEYLEHTFQLLFSGAVTDREYTFHIDWPRGYAAQETEGLYERFTGIIGTGPKGAGKGYPAVLSVIEAPDITHGGQWATCQEHAAYRVEVWRRFGSAVPGAGADIRRDEPAEIDGRPARCIEADYEIGFPELGPDNAVTRVRERAIYTQAGSRLYSLSLVCEAAEWDGRVPEFERAVRSFRLS